MQLSQIARYHRIATMLAKRTMNVCQISKILNVSESTVEKDLHFMKKHLGLVTMYEYGYGLRMHKATEYDLFAQVKAYIQKNHGIL